MLASALSEVVSLGAVLPFIGILTAPDRVFNKPVIQKMAGVLGITSASQLILPLVLFFVMVALASGALRLILLWGNTRLSHSIASDLSFEAYRRTLYQPYKVHIARNSSEVINGILGKIGMATDVLYSLLVSASSTFLLIVLILALMAIDPVVVSIVSAIFGLSYVGISWIYRQKLKVNSRRIATESTQQVKALYEGLGGIRDVLIDGSQPIFCDAYRKADTSFRRAKASVFVISSSPRFVMEVIGMVMIAGLAYGLSLKEGGIGSALPVLGALALGAQRIIPALQQIYVNWALVVGNQYSLSDAIDLLDQPLPPEALEPAPEQMRFNEAIHFEGVRFRYSDVGPWVLDGIDFRIPKGARVGFVGATGSGKSTTLDLLMGLLEPTDGRVLVDGTPINGQNRRSWQALIAHVPQSIFLADTTLAENIAFGVPKKQIDMVRVREAASQAHIANFIESHLAGYEAIVGERGIRLSGGQRQRIGIARALYRKASVLIFDEATSALDNSTEHAIMKSIEDLNRDLTILIIAHRLTTVQHCDLILELTHGKVVAQGSYEQLIQGSSSFRSMAMGVV